MDDSRPATRDDAQTVKDEVRLLKDDGKRIEKKFDAKFERLYEADDQILTVLTNIDKRLSR